MKRIILCLSLFAFFGSQAQQINPVPDYVFSNKMSVGRNAVTDTAAYFSIGPRYGAIRGMMPPMVTDTASMSATKRNGLLIFSIQKNKYLYWDSVGSKWAEMAGTAGSAITGSGVAGYMPEFTTSTNLDTTRLYHSAGRFAIGSTTTTNGVFNVYSGQSYFDTSLKVGSQTLLADEGKNEVYVNTTTDAGAFTLQMDGNANFNASTAEGLRLRGGSGLGLYQAFRNTTLFPLFIGFGSELNGNATINDAVLRYSGSNNLLISGDATERARFNGAGELLIGTTTDAGAYALQVAGAIYNTTGAVLAASSGEVLIGSQTDFGDYKLQVNGNLIVRGSAGAGQGISVSHNTGSISIENSMESDGDGYIYLRNGSGTEKVLIYSNGNSYFDGGNVGIGTTSPTQKLHVNGNILTAAPSGGTAKPFKIGEAATVSPTSPNRTIRVEIDGTVYYIHAKTTND